MTMYVMGVEARRDGMMHLYKRRRGRRSICVRGKGMEDIRLQEGIRDMEHPTPSLVGDEAKTSTISVQEMK